MSLCVQSFLFLLKVLLRRSTGVATDVSLQPVLPLGQHEEEGMSPLASFHSASFNISFLIVTL